MDENKQIEEMAKFLTHCFLNCAPCDKCRAYLYSEQLYNAGYRKQSEWISVSERLPESLQRVLAINTRGDMFTSVYISFATGKNAWSTPYSYLGDITHWMPLPEPPKGV